MGSASDDQGFDDLVREYYPDLFRFALSLCRERMQAEDLTQQSFLVYARKGDQLRDESKVKSWLFTTLYREFLAQKRKLDRVETLDASESEFRFPQEEATQGRDLDGRFVLAALRELDEVYRVPLTLFYLRELAYREISEILDIPMGTVMSRLSRGKAELRKKLRMPSK